MVICYAFAAVFGFPVGAYLARGADILTMAGGAWTAATVAALGVGALLAGGGD